MDPWNLVGLLIKGKSVAQYPVNPGIWYDRLVKFWQQESNVSWYYFRTMVCFSLNSGIVHAVSNFIDRSITSVCCDSTCWTFSCFNEELLLNLQGITNKPSFHTLIGSSLTNSQSRHLGTGLFQEVLIVVCCQHLVPYLPHSDKLNHKLAPFSPELILQVIHRFFYIKNRLLATPETPSVDTPEAQIQHLRSDL